MVPAAHFYTKYPKMPFFVGFCNLIFIALQSFVSGVDASCHQPPGSQVSKSCVEKKKKKKTVLRELEHLHECQCTELWVASVWLLESVWSAYPLCLCGVQ